MMYFQDFLEWMDQHEDMTGMKPSIIEMDTDELKQLKKDAPARIRKFEGEYYFFDIRVRIKK